jgi:hypothetical protein
MSRESDWFIVPPAHYIVSNGLLKTKNEKL